MSKAGSVMPRRHSLFYWLLGLGGVLLGLVLLLVAIWLYIRDAGQPFGLGIEEQLSWKAMSLPVFLALGVFIASATILLAFYTRAIGAGKPERERTERELRESEARYRSLVENAAEAIVVFDVDRRQFTEVNVEAERLFGLRRGELLGRDPFSMSPERQPDGRCSRESGWQAIEEAITGVTNPVRRVTP